MPKAPKTVKLITLPKGTTFTIPGSGRKGLVLRVPTDSSAYCRVWFLPEEVEQQAGLSKKYDDLTISSYTEVVPAH